MSRKNSVTAAVPDPRSVMKLEPGVVANQPARQLASQWAERYVEALASDIPFDTAPGDIDLIAGVLQVYDRLESDRVAHGIPHGTKDTALRAGYLLGIEIGRRMGRS